MAKGKNQYVVSTKDCWGVKGEVNSKLTAKTDTKADALCRKNKQKRSYYMNFIF